MAEGLTVLITKDFFTYHARISKVAEISGLALGGGRTCKNCLLVCIQWNSVDNDAFVLYFMLEVHKDTA